MASKPDRYERFFPLDEGAKRNIGAGRVLANMVRRGELPQFTTLEEARALGVDLSARPRKGKRKKGLLPELTKKEYKATLDKKIKDFTKEEKRIYNALAKREGRGYVPKRESNQSLVEELEDFLADTDEEDIPEPTEPPPDFVEPSLVEELEDFLAEDEPKEVVIPKGVSTKVKIEEPITYLSADEFKKYTTERGITPKERQKRILDIEFGRVKRDPNDFKKKEDKRRAIRERDRRQREEFIKNLSDPLMNPDPLKEIYERKQLEKKQRELKEAVEKEKRLANLKLSYKRLQLPNLSDAEVKAKIEENLRIDRLENPQFYPDLVEKMSVFKQKKIQAEEEKRLKELDRKAREKYGLIEGGDEPEPEEGEVEKMEALKKQREEERRLEQLKKDEKYAWEDSSTIVEDLEDFLRETETDEDTDGETTDEELSPPAVRTTAPRGLIGKAPRVPIRPSFTNNPLNQPIEEDEAPIPRFDNNPLYDPRFNNPQFGSPAPNPYDSPPPRRKTFSELLPPKIQSTRQPNWDDIIEEPTSRSHLAKPISRRTLRREKQFAKITRQDVSRQRRVATPSQRANARKSLEDAGVGGLSLGGASQSYRLLDFVSRPRASTQRPVFQMLLKNNRERGRK